MPGSDWCPESCDAHKIGPHNRYTSAKQKKRRIRQSHLPAWLRPAMNRQPVVALVSPSAGQKCGFWANPMLVDFSSCNTYTCSENEQADSSRGTEGLCTAAGPAENARSEDRPNRECWS